MLVVESCKLRTRPCSHINGRKRDVSHQRRSSDDGCFVTPPKSNHNQAVGEAANKHTAILVAQSQQQMKTCMYARVRRADTARQPAWLYKWFADGRSRPMVRQIGTSGSATFATLCGCAEAEKPPLPLQPCLFTWQGVPGCNFSCAFMRPSVTGRQRRFSGQPNILLLLFVISWFQPHLSSIRKEILGIPGSDRQDGRTH